MTLVAQRTPTPRCRSGAGTGPAQQGEQHALALSPPPRAVAVKVQSSLYRRRCRSGLSPTLTLVGRFEIELEGPCHNSELGSWGTDQVTVGSGSLVGRV